MPIVRASPAGSDAAWAAATPASRVEQRSSPIAIIPTTRGNLRRTPQRFVDREIRVTTEFSNASLSSAWFRTRSPEIARLPPLSA
jgi:hypothetical protein